jgi:hypothetical protein
LRFDVLEKVDYTGIKPAIFMDNGKLDATRSKLWKK